MFLFYELSTRTLVSLTDENGESRVMFSTGLAPALANCLIMDRNSVTLHQNDVYVLDSTKSGPLLRTKESGLYDRILRPLFDDLFKVEHTYIATTSSTSIDEFSSTLEYKGKSILMIIIAGDTSISEFVNSLPAGITGDIKIFVVPAGTGNSLALSLGITDEAKAVQRLFLHTSNDIAPFHIYQCIFPPGSFILGNTGLHRPLVGPIFLVAVASWAFHASLVADSDTEEMRKHGVNRFKIAAHGNLNRRQEYNGDITISGNDGLITSHRGPFAYLVITPSQKFEPTFKILPKGNIFDSDLYVVSFETSDDDSYILEIMKEVYNDGNHVTDDRVSYDQVRKDLTITLTMGRNESFDRRRFCIDGAVVVVPDTDGNVISIGYHGNNVHGWNLAIVS